MSPTEPSFDQALELFQEGRYEQADFVCGELLKRNKRDVDALQLRGTVAMTHHQYTEALRLYEKCLSQRPDWAPFWVLAGSAEALQGKFDKAIERYDEALRIQPNLPDASAWKAKVYEWAGAHAKARKVLRPFVAAGTETPSMAEVQARIDLHDDNAADAVARLEKHLADPQLSPDARHRMGHLAGRALERLERFDDAFAAHTDANRAVAVGFAPDADTDFVDRLIEVYSAEGLAQLPRHPKRAEGHVFIAGMPRSGTTLIEQIIDAHPDAVGVGENHTIELAVRRLQSDLGAAQPYPECVKTLQPADIPKVAQRYLGGLSKTARAAGVIANKHLCNYRNLGFIALLFPGARVIHCGRDPLDTCLSCYMSDILPSAHPYISDLEHIGLVYRSYERLMEHWRAVLDLPILDVRYEDLVDDLEGSVRRILEFCELPWDDACVRFHESKRAVFTLSYDQVRQPIYRSSVGRWKRYEKHLGPLRAALGQDVADPAG